MIQRTIETWQTLSWQDELAQMIDDPKVLLQALELSERYLPAAQQAHTLFPLRTTASFISKIAKNDPNDPLLRQVLPLEAELHTPPDYSPDPLGEAQCNPVKGIVHKYKGRVLVIGATQCAINCRYCFRRAFDYAGNQMSQSDWQAAFDYIRHDKSIEEVILSGGDPLIMSNSRLSRILDSLENIEHLERVRIHSRLPIVLPTRIDAPLIERFAQSRLQTMWVIHCNHPNEIDDSVSAALQYIHQAGMPLLNQSVLLKGVNDCAKIQIKLSKLLFKNNVLPYYLHLLDKVVGASHFDLPKAQALAIYERMRDSLPGYLLPKLVQEVAGKPAKQPVA